MTGREIGIFCPATVGFDPLVSIEFIHGCSTAMRIISRNLSFEVESPLTREVVEDVTQRLCIPNETLMEILSASPGGDLRRGF